MSTEITIGTVISAVIPAVIVSTSLLGPLLLWAVRRRMHRKPCHVHFVVERGGKQYKVYELVVQSHSPEVHLELRIRPRIKFAEQEIEFGFRESMGLAAPNPVGTESTFVSEGARKRETPGSNPDHYIDQKNTYHMQRDHVHRRHIVNALGYCVETHDAGVYPVHLTIVTEKADGKPPHELTLRVEDEPLHTEMVSIKKHWWSKAEKVPLN